MLSLQNIGKTYRNSARPAVRDVSFAVIPGMILALVGESGSGKTTLLRLIAGLEKPDSGTITLDGQQLSSPGEVMEPEYRQIGLVFQHHALFPHLTVSRNLAFGIHRMPAPKQQELISGLLTLTRLQGLENRFPHELSGGERQRVALARALAPNPRLLLLDEPFSSLDARLRQTVRDDTRTILKARGATAVIVTHDTADALAIADRIVVLKGGQIQQIGAPPEVYHAPANTYVASFFGNCNFLPFHSLDHPSGTRILCHVGPPNTSCLNTPYSSGGSGLWVRPEDLELAHPQPDGRNGLCGKVTHVSFAGAHLDVSLVCQVPGNAPFEVIVRHHGPASIRVGESWAIIPRPRRNLS